MGTSRSIHWLGCLGAACVVFAAEFADADSSHSAAAEALFREGKLLLEAGDTEHACPKLAASQRIEPALGTLLNLALCYERAGRTASAWTNFSAAAAQASAAGRSDRERFAREHAAKLETMLHRIKISAGPLPKGASAELDGESLAIEAFGSEIPLDPGEHTLRISAPGTDAWSTTLRISSQAGVDLVEVPPLGEPPEAPEPPPTEPPPVRVQKKTEPKAMKPAAPKRAPESSSRRTWGYVAGAGGVAALGVGTFFFARMLALKNERDDLCPPGTPCRNQGAVDDDRQARTDRSLGLAFTGLGAVALGASAWLIFGAEPERAPASARLTPGGPTFTLRGSF